jgi:hypothetical protein
MLHVPTVPPTVSEAHDATTSSVSPVPEAVSSVPLADTATLERLIDVLQRELDAAREREKLLTQMMHERETQLTQAAHERETLLLQLLAQVQQQNQRLLDMPRTPPPLSAQDTPGAPQRLPPAQRPPQPPPGPQGQREAPRSGDPRGEMRLRIVALVREHPEGLTHHEMQRLLGLDKNLSDTLTGMLRYGLLRRVERGRYVAKEPTRHDQP